MTDPHDTLEHQVRDLAESVLVANDKLELAILDVSKQLRAINSTLISIAAELIKARG